MSPRNPSLLGLSLGVLVASCGQGPTEAKAPAAPAEVPALPPMPETTAASAAAAPSASPEEPAEPEKRAPSGRPAVIKADPVSVSDTFGSSPGAKLEVGEGEPAVLRIPEYALARAVNVTLKVDPKGKSFGSVVGRVYRITPVVPPSSEATNVETVGDPFLLELPAGSRKEANLAVGEIALDPKGKEKVTWHVFAPKRIDDATNKAYFELPSLRDVYLHVTTAKP